MIKEQGNDQGNPLYAKCAFFSVIRYCSDTMAIITLKTIMAMMTMMTMIREGFKEIFFYLSFTTRVSGSPHPPTPLVLIVH